MNNNFTNNPSIFNGGYFILNESRTQCDIENYTNLIITKEDCTQIKSFIIMLIRNAQKVIKLCSFIISDEDIASELTKKCNESSVAIFLLTQLDDRKFNFDFLPDEVNAKKEGQQHLSNISKLNSLGAHVRAATSAHAKFIICDNSIAMVMSANMTSMSLNSNPESGIKIGDKQSTMELDKLFDILFQKGTEYTGFTYSGKSKQLISSRSTAVKVELLDLINTSTIKFTWSNIHMSLYDCIIKIINESKDDILLSTYSVVGLDKLPEITVALQKAIDQGRKVVLFCRAMNYRQDHLENCAVLNEIGVEIYGDYFNHSKGIISGNIGMLFTANIDGKYGLINGFEVGAILSDNQLKEFRNFIEWQIKTAPFSFKMHPKKETYFKMNKEFQRFKNVSPPNFPKNFKIFSSLLINNKIMSTPLYLIMNREQAFFKMRIGNEEFDIDMQDEIITIKNKAKDKTYDRPTYLLEYDHLQIINT
jgi:hypothetical protein